MKNGANFSTKKTFPSGFIFQESFFFSQQKHTALLNLSVDEQQQYFTIKYILRKYCELNSKQKV